MNLKGNSEMQSEELENCATVRASDTRLVSPGD